MSLPTFVTDEPLVAHGTVTLGEDSAHHMRVRRLDSGTEVLLVDGVGARATGTITQLAKRHATVSVGAVDRTDAPAPIHLLVPVADRDRMLWLAEKSTELQVSSWRPVVYRRSKNVSPRGEGPTFQQRVRARMRSALEQSGGAWMPAMFPDATVEHAIAASTAGLRLVLDAGPLGGRGAANSATDGGANGAMSGDAPATVLEVVMPAVKESWSKEQGLPAITIAVGPEGGYEEAELAALVDAGFVRASLGQSILRFETAAVAGVAAVRAALELGRHLNGDATE